MTLDEFERRVKAHAAMQAAEAAEEAARRERLAEDWRKNEERSAKARKRRAAIGRAKAEAKR